MTKVFPHCTISVGLAPLADYLYVQSFIYGAMGLHGFPIFKYIRSVGRWHPNAAAPCRAVAAALCRAVAAERGRVMSGGGGRIRPCHVGQWRPNAAASCRVVATAECGRAMSGTGGRTRPRHVGRWRPHHVGLP